LDGLKQSMSTNGLTKYEATEPPAQLPGRSAATLFLRGTIVELCGFAMTVPLVISAVNQHAPLSVFFFSLLIILGFTGGTVSILGMQKGRAEQRAGYATVPKIASVNPYLFLLDRRDFHVLLYRNQPRPRTRNRKDMVAWRAQWDYPDQAGR
jgi:hypothetical protein